MLSQVQSGHTYTSLMFSPRFQFVSTAMPPSPSSPRWHFTIKCDLHVTTEGQQGCPSPLAQHHRHCHRSPSPFHPHPLTPHGPLRQLREKGHPEERAPPRRPQWQYHIMPCPSDAASSKGYTLWDVTGPLYRAGGIGSIILFFSILGWRKDIRGKPPPPPPFANTPTVPLNINVPQKMHTKPPGLSGHHTPCPRPHLSVHHTLTDVLCSRNTQ